MCRSIQSDTYGMQKMCLLKGPEMVGFKYIYYITFKHYRKYNKLLSQTLHCHCNERQLTPLCN